MFSRRIVRVLLALGLGLLLTEVSLHIVWSPSPVFDDYDDARGVRLLPGAKGWYTKEGRGWVEVNSLGYRDVEHARAKPADVFRIAVLGDSFTEARQVDLDEVYWKLLESTLAGTPDLRGRRVEAMGFGIGGYGTSQELITLEQDVLAFSPDLVLLGYFNGNDLVNNSRSLSWRLRGEWLRPFHVLDGGRLVLDASFHDHAAKILIRKLVYFALHYSRCALLVNQLRRDLEVRRLRREETEQRESERAPAEIERRSGELGLDAAAFEPPRSPEWVEAWDVTEALIVEMHRLTTAAGARFVLVVLGDPIQVDPDVRRREEFARSLGVDDLFYSERRLAALGERSGFPVITLGPRMQQRADRDKIAFHGFQNSVLGTGHWNAAGHRAAAECITADLIERKWIR